MKNAVVKKVIIGVSMVVGASAIATAPAQAGNLTNATIGGSAATDYFVYDSNATNTFKVESTQANVQKVLNGNATNPTGNVELRAGSEQSNFDFSKNTTLSGKIGNQNLTLSSLTATDWFGSTLNKSYTGNTLATKWFNQFLVKAGKADYVGKTMGNLAFNQFLGLNGFERSSDPNISYVNQDDKSGLINIGLAGHFDLKAAYAGNAQFKAFAGMLPNGFQASEVVKYTYNGVTDFLYSFEATKTGLTDTSDKISHSGNYAVSIKGIVPPKSVPEPSVVLGLLAVAGVFATQGKLKLKKV